MKMILSRFGGKMGREVLEKNISIFPGDREKNSNRFRGDYNSQKLPLERSGKWLSNKPPHTTINDLLRVG